MGNEIKVNDRYRFSFEKIKSQEVKFDSNPNIEIIDGEQSGDRLSIRFWKKGDHFKPLGMQQKRKLSDFFIDLKLERRIKNQIPIICSKKNIVWIAGYRLADDFKVTEKTRVYYKLKLDLVNENS